ncbi:hypothetical protein AVEN_192882-1 [Araneus ventricosus]|uniref:Uncharacterized protein n=1 Tax=Araneus ventricosus TaxID=182803 RepID=A0A4Y2Q0V9_ARAVE|nr:hypothetical protein AVEN_192882-1 [Araneus ventricosus]
MRMYDENWTVVVEKFGNPTSFFIHLERWVIKLKLGIHEKERLSHLSQQLVYIPLIVVEKLGKSFTYVPKFVLTQSSKTQNSSHPTPPPSYGGIRVSFLALTRGPNVGRSLFSCYPRIEVPNWNRRMEFWILSSLGFHHFQSICSKFHRDGIPGNEFSDQFAKLAITNGELMNHPLPYSYLKLQLKRILLESWNDCYTQYQSASGTRVRAYVPRVDEKMLVFNKYTLYFLAGHGSVPCYLSRFKILSSPYCECGAIGDPDHYVFEFRYTNEFHLGRPTENAKPLWPKHILSCKINRDKLISCFKISEAICDHLCSM